MQVAVDTVRAALERLAGSLGFDQPAAALLADHFLDAELRGAATHGVGRMRWLAGFADLRPSAAPVLVERAEGIARYDAAGALGYLALAGALDAELERPPEGARLIVVGGCFPTGRLGWYAERAARSGLVALVWATRRRGSCIRRAGRRCSGRTPSAWHCRASRRRSSTSRWAASPTARCCAPPRPASGWRRVPPSGRTGQPERTPPR